MRKRINKVCIASSDNYIQSKKVHKAMLEENHINNSALFLTINTTLTSKSPTDLEKFEEGLIKQIREFKLNKAV